LEAIAMKKKIGLDDDNFNKDEKIKTHGKKDL